VFSFVFLFPDSLSRFFFIKSSLGHALFRLRLMDLAPRHLENSIEIFDEKYDGPRGYRVHRREQQRLRRHRKATGGDPRPNETERAMYDDGKSCAAAHVNLGLCLHSMGKDDDAGDHFQLAVEIDRHEPAAHTHWAQMLEKNKDYDAALHHFKAALALDPSDVVALTRTGSIYDMLQRNDLATTFLRRAIEVDDSYESAHFALALCLSRGEKHLEAIPHLRRACELAPTNASAWLSLGIALEAAKVYDEGLECIRKSVEIDPKSKFGQHSFKKSLKSKDAREQVERQRRHTLAAQKRAVDAQIKMKQNAPKKCKMCTSSGTLTCGRCKRAFYCSSEHQRLDWKSGHRKECSPP
jgi:tetratricopeptide (TPR) repeat protein